MSVRHALPPVTREQDAACWLLADEWDQVAVVGAGDGPRGTRRVECVGPGRRCSFDVEPNGGVFTVNPRRQVP